MVFRTYPIPILLSVSIRDQTKFDFNLATAALSQIFGGLLYSKGSSIHTYQDMCSTMTTIEGIYYII